MEKSLNDRQIHDIAYSQGLDPHEAEIFKRGWRARELRTEATGHGERSKEESAEE